jgi:hypothetical protein
MVPFLYISQLCGLYEKYCTKELFLTSGPAGNEIGSDERLNTISNRLVRDRVLKETNRPFKNEDTGRRFSKNRFEWPS